MSSGGWSCPHEVSGKCSKVNNLPCDPGMKGCELYGRYAFFNDDKNERLRQKQAHKTDADQDTEADDTSAKQNEKQGGENKATKASK